MYIFIYLFFARLLFHIISDNYPCNKSPGHSKANNYLIRIKVYKPHKHDDTIDCLVLVCRWFTPKFLHINGTSYILLSFDVLSLYVIAVGCCC